METEGQLGTDLKWINVHACANYVRVRARIIMKINMAVDRHTDSLSFKFYEDPFFGSREIEEINMSMHYSHFLKHVVMSSSHWQKNQNGCHFLVFKATDLKIGMQTPNVPKI